MVSNQGVVSSNIKSVGYNDDTQDLLVVFHSGKAYIYSGVDQGTHQSFMAASSHGNFLNAQIKPRFKVTPYPDLQSAIVALGGSSMDKVTAAATSVMQGFFNLRDFIKPGVPILNLFTA